MTVSTVAVSLTLPTRTVQTGDQAGTGAITRHVREAVIRCSGANVRWRDGGSAPTASVGAPLLAGEILIYDGDSAAIQFIRSGASDATLDISYYG